MKDGFAEGAGAEEMAGGWEGGRVDGGFGGVGGGGKARRMEMRGREKWRVEGMRGMGGGGRLWRLWDLFMHVVCLFVAVAVRAGVYM